MSSLAMDLTDPKAVLHQLLDSDQRMRDEFVAALGTELEQLAAGVAACFQRLLGINERLVEVNAIRS